MRVYLIFIGTFLLAAYAWKDWFFAAGGLVLMMAVLDYPDMPRELLGIHGLNLWNLLFLAAVPAWLAGRRREGLRWDLPPLAGVLLLIYVLIISLSFLRLLLDPGPISFTTSQLVGEYLINPLKYLVPALMFFDGARNRSRLLLALACILGVYVFLALLVVRWVPLSEAMSGTDLASATMRRLDREVGYWRTDLSVMLAGASWAILAVRALVASRLGSLGLVGIAAFVAFAQALTAGRGGYVAWLVVGLIMCLVRWRIYLVVAPLAVAAILAVAPGVRDRALEGFTGSERQDSGTIDTETLSAGRLGVWPYMFAKVRQAPFVGFGRLGYDRSGLRAFLDAEVDPTFTYPHNAYIEWLLDNGWLGMAPMVVTYGFVLALSLVLFTDSRHPFFVAAGGVAFSLVAAWLVGGITGRQLYPTEATVGVWAAVGLMLRVWVERSRGGAGAS
jgi:O-antigen ligase